MQHPIQPRDGRFGTFIGVPHALLVAAAMAIGCSLATVAAAAADDKAKAVVEAPSKAADPMATVVPPAATVEPDTAEAKPDSTDRRRDRRGRSHIRMGDDDFDSFNEALHTAPWVVGLAFLVAGSILLTPVFLLVGIIWYKLRKTRLQNEAVLKLAERGAMAPAQAADAVMSGVAPEAAALSSTAEPLAPGASAVPVYQRAVAARQRAVWSDLRKGVILTAVGLAFVFYWMVESGAASWLGLVLMFLGIGYILLWWFEDRHLKRHETGADVGVDVGKS
jgi:hypothetical protein